MILAGKPKNLEKTCPCVNFSTTDPTWTDTGVNPGLSAEKPVPNRLCQGKVYKGITTSLSKAQTLLI
jgi:hypothetical protein